VCCSACYSVWTVASCQHAVLCCSVLQGVAVRCRVLQGGASVFLYVVVCLKSNALQCTQHTEIHYTPHERRTHSSRLQNAATHCTTLEHTVVRCKNSLHHTTTSYSTHCITLNYTVHIMHMRPTYYAERGRERAYSRSRERTRELQHTATLYIPLHKRNMRASMGGTYAVGDCN